MKTVESLSFILRMMCRKSLHLSSVACQSYSQSTPTDPAQATSKEELLSQISYTTGVVLLPIIAVFNSNLKLSAKLSVKGGL